MKENAPSRQTGLRVAAAVLGIGACGAGLIVLAPAGVEAEVPLAKLPPPPANGEMGFVVSEFVPPVLQGKDACPEGTVLKVKDQWLALQPPAERARLTLKENEKEFTTKWQASIFGPNGTNVCSQPDMFTRPDMRTVKARNAYGLDLDGGKGDDTCEHEEFAGADGTAGVDNQEYRVMGCTLEWRGVDGIGGDIATGMRQFHASGEWTQVILLRGVDSLENDPEVEVVYANTPDRPPQDSTGKFLAGGSFTVSDKAPRNRNVLKGRIVNGVLTTDPQDILLVQTWGQGGARDVRGNRAKFDYRRARLRLAFQPDGSLKGMLGGYRPVFDIIKSPALGGAGSPLVAGIDCAQYLQTLRKYADGMRDPKTGKCTAVSGAMRVIAIPAFVNDIPASPASAKKAVK